LRLAHLKKKSSIEVWGSENTSSMSLLE